MSKKYKTPAQDEVVPAQTVETTENQRQHTGAPRLTEAPGADTSMVEVHAENPSPHEPAPELNTPESRAEAAHNAAEQGAAAFSGQIGSVMLRDAPGRPSPVFTNLTDPPDMVEYIDAKMAEGKNRRAVLTEVSYPGATAHVHAHREAGVSVTSGPLGCTWSDGERE